MILLLLWRLFPKAQTFGGCGVTIDYNLHMQKISVLKIYAMQLRDFFRKFNKIDFYAYFDKKNRYISHIFAVTQFVQHVEI